MDPTARQLYQQLVRVLEERGVPENQPVTVAALYEELVPYHAVRSELDVALNADYEHALLRLLGGAGDRLIMEPEEAREELRREADAPYPDVGLFRKFAASSVWVRRPADHGGTADPEPAGPAHADEAAGSVDAPSADPPSADPPSADPPPREPHRSPRRPASADRGPGSAVCGSCGGRLPSGRSVRYCPHCGRDQRIRQCPGCGTVLEADWSFCISCGRDTAAGAP